MKTNTTARANRPTRRLGLIGRRAAEVDCPWKAAGLCRGLSLSEDDGRMICTCAVELMAPSPDRVLETFTDLGLSDEQIGRYFHIPTRCVTALRRPV
ncbi:hypothetical protein SAMN05878503_105172 [Cereibacter ovatus]|uniref:Uncharacterized protein n=1 Tax=Cereibacter ovatus TaxID=439529 RepID=A0A285CTH0_9RHOB|nr:hypothetical protein [Cereibacter ovatus]SNX70263.1 hypothetical protein SAMN05878503_105172 [Cereibacter ovatus]